MAEVALVVSIAAGLGALVSLLLQFRESGRRKEEIRLLRDEAGRRHEELGLLRQQVARQDQAHVAVRDRVHATSSEHEFFYDVPLVNTGVAIARDVDVEFVRGDQVAASTRCERPLNPADTTVVRVSIPRGQYAGEYDIVVEWDDERGRIREATGVQVGPPAP